MTKRKRIVNELYPISKKRKIDTQLSDSLRIKLEFLQLIAVTAERVYNINLTNLNRIKEYLISSKWIKMDKVEALNDYYFYLATSDTDHIHPEIQYQYMSLSMICKMYCSASSQYIQPSVLLWIELTYILMNHGMNPFSNHYTPLYIPDAILHQYVHKTTIRVPSNIRKHWGFKIHKESEHYKLLIHAHNTYSDTIPPIIHIMMQNTYCICVSIIGQSYFNNPHNVSPQSLECAIRHLSSPLLINIESVDIYALDQMIYKQFMSCNSYMYYTGCSANCNKWNQLMLSYFFIIKCFYQHYQDCLLFKLKNNRNLLPFDVIKLIINEYCFQDLTFMESSISVNELFCIFFCNIYRLSEEWLRWIYDHYLKELFTMIHASAIDLLTGDIGSNIISELHRCKIDEMSLYILGLFKHCTIRYQVCETQIKYFNSLFIKAAKTLEYWPMIVLIRNGLVDISIYELDFQLMEHEMDLEEIEDIEVLHGIECGIDDQNESVFVERNKARTLLRSLLRKHSGYDRLHKCNYNCMNVHTFWRKSSPQPNHSQTLSIYL